LPHNNHFHKRHLILNIINHLGPISRTELINLTDYRPASISALIKELLDEQLIVESGNYSAGHGRKRTLLEINKTHLCAVGMSFSASSVTFIVAQFDGSILQQSTLGIAPDLQKDLQKELLITQITEHVAKLLSEHCDKEILGIGISDPPHDPTSYHAEHSLPVNYAHFNDWVHLGLKPRLESTFGLRVETYSGVALPAMAEQRFGVARGARDFICIELSNGIGSSICCNGMAVTGARGMAGELGHTVIDRSADADRLCYCGKPGCSEVSTAYPALVSQLEAALSRGVFSSLKEHLDPKRGITVEAIRAALEENDRMCMYYVKEIAMRLGLLIANAVNLLNPELIVLYGFLLELGDYFYRQLEIAIRENTLSVSGDLDIRISDSLETILPLGAVAEICSSYLRSDDYKWVYQLQPSDLEEWTLIQNNNNETGDTL